MDQTKEHQFLNRLMSTMFSLLFIFAFSTDQMKAYILWGINYVTSNNEIFMQFFSFLMVAKTNFYGQCLHLAV